MFFIIETAHACEPIGLLQDEDIGISKTGALQHSDEGKVSLLLLELRKSAGVVGPGGGVLGIVLRGRHHEISHPALEFIALLQNRVAVGFAVTKTLQHIACGINVAGLGLPAVGVQFRIVLGILESQGRRRNIDGKGVRVVGIRRCKAAAERKGFDRCHGIGQIFCHLLQISDILKRFKKFRQRSHSDRVPGIPVQPHLVIIPDQLLAVSNVGVGEGLIALQNFQKLRVYLELTLGKSVIGDISGGDGCGREPLPVDSRVEIFCFGEAVQLFGILDQIGTYPVVGAGHLRGIGFIVGQSERGT